MKVSRQVWTKREALQTAKRFQKAGVVEVKITGFRGKWYLVRGESKDAIGFCRFCIEEAKRGARR